MRQLGLKNASWFETMLVQGNIDMDEKFQTFKDCLQTWRYMDRVFIYKITVKMANTVLSY